MIVRPKLNWFALLLVVRGSVLPRIALRLLGVTLLAVGVTLIHGQVLSWKVSLNFVPFSLIGLTLAIFLSFRNSTAYARYWEARTLWGSLLNASRSLAAQALTLPQHPAQPADGTSAHDFILRLCAFAQALRHQLRGTDPAADLARFLPADEVAALLAKTPVTASATKRLLLALHQWVAGHTHAGRLPPAVVPAMLRRLDHLCDALGGCQRIGNTPIPFTYTVIIHRCVYLYCVLLPFGLVDSLGWMTGSTSTLFRPDNNLTRAEAATILVRALGLKTEEGSAAFPDTASHWAKKEINSVYKAGLMVGDAQGYFNPDKPITREELAVILNRALKLEDVQLDFYVYPDVNPHSASWSYQAIGNTSYYGLFQGSNGLFRPKDIVSRAEMATVMVRVYEYMERLKNQPSPSPTPVPTPTACEPRCARTLTSSS